jgi:hypothetical protein
VGHLAGATRGSNPEPADQGSWIEEFWSRRRIPPEVLLLVRSYPSFRGGSHAMTSGLNVHGLRRFQASICTPLRRGTGTFESTVLG